jgi:LAO/AO transport system kinase
MSAERELAQRVVAGERRAVAKALNLIEDRRAAAEPRIVELLRALAQLAVGAELGRHPLGHRVGLTGPPGAGKSSLIAALARKLREGGQRVGVLAVDPSSPRSGGALLGDRVRIGPDPDDDGLFVRSLASQGDLGGLARAAAASIDVLGAAFDVVLVETVGVGQSEVDVEGVVDTTAVIVQPGSGDTLQFYKAGIIEVADLFVVTKSDLGELADRTVRDLRAALGRSRRIVAVSAKADRGIEALVEALAKHRADAIDSYAERRTRGAIAQVQSMVRRRYGEYGIERIGGSASLIERIEELLQNGSVAREAALLIGQQIERSVG